MASVSNVDARPTGSGNSVVPLLATPCSASLHQLYAGMCNLSMARDWLVNWVTFSSTVMRWTRSAARCSGGKEGLRYAGGSKFCAYAQLAIRKTATATRVLRFSVRMFGMGLSIRALWLTHLQRRCQPTTG